MIILRQKEFGWIRSLLEKSVKQNKENLNKITERLKNSKRVINSEIEKKIIESNSKLMEISSSDKYNDGESITYFPNDDRSEVLYKRINDPLNFYTEDEIEILMLLIMRSDNKISTIFWDRCHGLEELAHEIGHVKNYNGSYNGSFLSKFINKGADFSKRLINLKPGIINALLSILGSANICWEETSATRKGYNMLKSFGLNEEDLKLAKENMDLALQTYRLVGKETWKKKLINSKIPQWLL